MFDDTDMTSSGSKRPQVYSAYIQPAQPLKKSSDLTFLKKNPEVKKPKLVDIKYDAVKDVIGVESFENSAQNLIVLNKDFLLVRIQDLMCFKGKCSIACVYGSLGISGYILNATNDNFKWHDLYSPETNSFLSIKNRSNLRSRSVDKAALSAIINKSIKEQDDEVIKSFLDNICLDTASLILVRRLESTICSYLGYIDNFKQVYRVKSVGRENNQIDSSFAQIGVFPISMNAYLSVFSERDEEKMISSEIAEFTKNGDAAAVIMSVGGKDVGKSTFLRYMINCLLNGCETVAYVDCDPGQCEFTLSGCISLNLISEPIFGPPHTHIKHNTSIESCFFFGHLSPSDTPAHYLQCIKKCYSKFLDIKGHQKIPLLINTMGWNQGLGLCLLKDILLQFSPTHVVQINHSVDVNKNLPIIDRTWLNTQDAHSPQNRFPRNDSKTENTWQKNGSTSLEESMETSPIDKYLHLPPYKLFLLKSYSKASPSIQKPSTTENKRYSAKDHRTIATVAYFASLQQPQSSFQSIHHLRPYRVAWSRFALHCAHVRVDSSQLFRIFNASLVGLCVVDEKHIKRNLSNPQLPSFFESYDNKTKEPVVYRCNGFGIIRGINTETNEFYILTPEETPSLSKVNLLVKGMLNLPAEFFYEQDSETACPYMSLADSLQTHKENLVGNEPVQRKYLIHQQNASK